jgi:hypothetical protein
MIIAISHNANIVVISIDLAVPNTVSSEKNAELATEIIRDSAIIIYTTYISFRVKFSFEKKLFIASPPV